MLKTVSNLYVSNIHLSGLVHVRKHGCDIQGPGRVESKCRRRVPDDAGGGGDGWWELAFRSMSGMLVRPVMQVLFPALAGSGKTSLPGPENGTGQRPGGDVVF